MADRVAVPSTGAHIEQLASPLDIVARPASPAVADLVGRGRTARLLALGRLELADLDPVADGASGETIAVGSELGDVLHAFVGSRQTVAVVDEHGQVVGSATPATVVRALDRVTADQPDETQVTDNADAPVGTVRS